eukprot:9740244-Prorocentrum_lima.AAC.1
MIGRHPRELVHALQTWTQHINNNVGVGFVLQAPLVEAVLAATGASSRSRSLQRCSTWVNKLANMSKPITTA